MASHPEMDGTSFDDLHKAISKQDTVDVWCLGCSSWTKMNASYAKFLQGEIESCSRCRGNQNAE